MTSFPQALVLSVLLFVVNAAAEQPLHTLHSFQRLQLSDQFFGEGATAADLNRDGHPDIISGPYWYAGPDFTERQEYYPAHPFSIEGYSDNFLTFAHDINNDGWTDILVVGFPGKEAFWYQNPKGGSGHWQRHLVYGVVDNESPTFTDLVGDSRPELVFHTQGRLGYVEIPEDLSTSPWKFVPISDDLGYPTYTHGLGVGDLNNDGRNDLLEKNGWWEQPENAQDELLWKFHRFPFADAGGAQMLVYDLDDDGDNDVITSKAAHAYGLAWFEQIETDGQLAFREHLIMGEHPEQNDYGLVFSQLHSQALADMDRDGVLDIVTGKRFWAHQGHDPGGHDPPVSYWFQTVRTDSGVQFVPHRIDGNSGVGTQVVVSDLNGDQWPDVIVGNKKGTFALLHSTKQVDKETWDAAQPERLKEEPNEPETVEKSAASGGIKPTDKQGRPLNLDFEAGDARDWKPVGKAFAGQPIWGDTVHARRTDSISGHMGDRWVGTYEVSGDEPQGTMTSATFEIAHPYAVFFVGGGSTHQTRVELVRADSQEVIAEGRGRDAEQMRPFLVDLREHQNQDAFLRIVDESSGPWGHINFDHFRFYDSKPQISVLEQKILQPDEYPHAGLTSDESINAMVLPEGFQATCFASEPDIKQPIAMALDDRGRVWIAEAYEYPQRAKEGEGRDRILIFEDTDGDGRFDTRKVFAEGLNLVSGLEVGHGGVWVGAAPYLLFIADENKDDVPDAEPRVLLDGWGYQDTHETLNSFMWGPDGWLYGCHGVFTHSRVGKPGTPDSQRTPLNAAIWRYHPLRHEFDIFAHGTSNPWGVDFNDHGQAVATACVIPHLFHMIQGARYHRQAGEHFNKFTYDDIKTIADHRHYLGDTPHSGNAKSDSAGGGHAHAGAMIYLGGLWPEKYRNHIFMNNIHGQRLNTDILDPHGSGLVGHHGPDFLLTQDRASQMLNFRYGPDGQVYIVDWYDMQACHDGNRAAHDRSNGRIYKVSYGTPEPVAVDLARQSDEELAELMLHSNDWYVRHARRLLQERAAKRSINKNAQERLVQIATTHTDSTRRLRAAWALHVTGHLTTQGQTTLLEDQNEYVRGWAIQLELENSQPDEKFLARLAKLAADDPSPVVRLYIASALQRIELPNRWPILEGLVAHAEDANDHNLPLMYWYAAEPLSEGNVARALDLAASCADSIPILQEFMLRRIGSSGSPESLAAIVRVLGDTSDAAQQQRIISSLGESLRGRRKTTAPADWPKTYATLMAKANPQIQSQATALGVKFGDADAMAALRKLVSEEAAEFAQRASSLQALLDAKDAKLVPVLLKLLSHEQLRASALSGLANYSDDAIPAAILEVYSKLAPAEKSRALATLASRSEFATRLLQAVEAGQVASADLTADLARQMHNLQDEPVSELLLRVWGNVRSTQEEKTKQIEEYRELLTNAAAQEADIEQGRAIFSKTCQQCHRLYGVGNTVGPDLTGSNRANLDYLLSNIVDPSALITKEYQNSVVLTDSGRVHTGIITSEDDKSIRIRTATESLVVPKEEIEERKLSDTSMMPDNQLKQFSSQQIVSLFAYLQGKSQVPILATADNAKSFFNGQDLNGWRGEAGLWSVEDGEIVGRSEGLDHNSFLISDLTAEDFELSLEIRLQPNNENSGIQFRSKPQNGFHEMFGYQADVGAGWWGKLYEEHGRQLLWDKPGDPHLKPGEWNRYVIRAEGHSIKTWLNDQLCVDLDDPEGATRGVFALQIHSGGPMEVRFRNLQLEILHAPQADSDE